MKLKTILFIIFVTSLYLNAVELTKEEKEWLSKNKILLAVDNQYAPMNFLNQQDKMDGLSIDYIKLIEKKIGKKIELYSTRWPQALQSAMEHTTDGIINANITPQRIKHLVFTKHYIQIPMAIITSNTALSYNSLNELNGKTVILKDKTVEVEYLANHYPKINLLIAKSYDQALRWLSSGKADAVMGHLAVVSHALRENLFTNLKVNFVHFDKNTGFQRIGIGNHKPLLKTILDKAIESITQAEHNQIRSRWIGREQTLMMQDTSLSDKEKAWLEKKIKVKVRVANVPPLHFMENNTAKGISVDFIKFVASRHNIDIEFVEGITWSDALKKVKNKTGEVDLILSISHSKEREKFINFTNSYIDLPNMIYTQTDSTVFSLDELKGKKVVIEKGFLVREFIKAENLDIKIVDAKNTLDALEQLSNDQADAYIGDILVANYFLEREGLHKIKLSAPTNFPKHTQFFGVRKDWPELSSIINKTLLSMNIDEKQIIKSKWLGGKFEVVDYEHLIEIIIVFLLIIMIILYFARKIKKKEEESNFLLNAVPINIFYKDKNFNYIKVNQTYGDFLEINPDDIIGKSDYYVYSKELASKYREIDKEVFSSKQRVEYEEDYLKNGEVIHVNKLKIPIIENGNVIGLLGLFWDVTKYKKALIEIQQKDEMLIAQSRNAAMGEMLSMIAHQWRQPLSIISMAVNNIKVDIELDSIDKDTFIKLSKDIENQCQYLSATISDFQNFFKPNKEKQKDVDISMVMENALDIISKSMENHNIKVIKKYNKNLTKIDIYAKELMQVFINILKNSKDALEVCKKDEKFVKISIEESDDSFLIEIKDNGGGIPSENLPKVFDPYFSTKQTLNGTGLGLYISKIIVEKHLFGKISVFNQDDGCVMQIKLLKQQD